MIQAKPKALTFDEFLKVYPEDGRYELVDGKIVRILATRQHEDVADYIQDLLKEEVKHQNLNYKVSNRIVLATLTQTGVEMGRNPDVSVISRNQWRSNRSAYTALREPIQLEVEVVSTNWEDDYDDKFDEYQRLGINEYWIVDYLALGSRSYLGNPKEPAIFVHVLDEDLKYHRTRFQGDERIASLTFPNLDFTINKILESEG
ncbi:MAG: Uma2 family endonuclease [Chroococcidiopsidaceae cyanobacterium CP_BM_RX_35]|nr:Uma2 family endonuclease [Chroococcidiopsidaceae cyanobacterium CP_BM_RX_35]